jgi:hypothetical protein
MRPRGSTGKATVKLPLADYRIVYFPTPGRGDVRVAARGHAGPIAQRRSRSNVLSLVFR